MARKEEWQADDINRKQNPDKDKRDINRSDDDRNVNEERQRQGNRGKDHDKEDMEQQPE